MSLVVIIVVKAVCKVTIVFCHSVTETEGANINTEGWKPNVLVWAELRIHTMETAEVRDASRNMAQGLYEEKATLVCDPLA